MGVFQKNSFFFIEKKIEKKKVRPTGGSVVPQGGLQGGVVPQGGCRGGVGPEKKVPEKVSKKNWP